MELEMAVNESIDLVEVWAMVHEESIVLIP
jgi:hypothetical protein